MKLWSAFLMAVWACLGCSRTEIPKEPPALTRGDVEAIVKEVVSGELARREAEQAEKDKAALERLAREAEKQHELDEIADAAEAELVRERAMALLTSGEKARVERIRSQLAANGVWIKRSDLTYAIGDGADLLMSDVVAASKTTDRGLDRMADALGLTPKQKVLMAAEFSTVELSRIAHFGSQLRSEKLLPDDFIKQAKRFWPLKDLLDQYADKRDALKANRDRERERQNDSVDAALKRMGEEADAIRAKRADVK